MYRDTIEVWSRILATFLLGAHAAIMLQTLNGMIHFTEYPVLLLNSTVTVLLC